MDAADIRALIALNNGFYARHAASFSATRTRRWDGWLRVADLLAPDIPAAGARGDAGGARGGAAAPGRRGRGGLPARAGGGTGPGSPAEAEGRDAGADLAVLDVACGNLRFEAFLGSAFPGARMAVHAVDSCPALARDAADPGEGVSVAYRRVDVLEELLADPAGGAGLAGIPRCGLVVCFGFMHHVPGRALREGLLRALAERTAPGGLLALSFWRYLDDPRLARRAGEAEALRGEDPRLAGLRLEEGDGFLGWQRDPSPLRYCHSFSEGEVDALAGLAESLGLTEEARWSADGPVGDLNRYLALRRPRS